MRYDVIVVGAGHNGLTAAALLARAGRKVLVLEGRSAAGGLAAPEEFHPGYSSQGLLLDTSRVRRAALSELGLERHGLHFLAENPPVFIPEENGPGLLLHRDPEKMGADAGGSLSKEDGSRYGEMRAFLGRVAPLLAGFLNDSPPAISSSGRGELWQALKPALALRKLGADDMMELLRVAPMSISDWLDEWFQSDLLKVAVAGPALEGTYMGPRSPGSVASFLLRECVAQANVRGGPAALIRALVAAAEEQRAEIRLSSPVRRIRVSDGAVVGVAAAGGENYDAPVVVSAADPKRTLFELMDPIDLPVSLSEAMRVFRTRGLAAKVNLALNAPLEFAGRPGRLFEAARTGPSMEGLEAAFDAAKYRGFSERPHLEIRIPTVADPSLAPEGRHVAEILVHFAARDLSGGWNPASRRALGDAVVRELARYAPAAPGRIVGMQVLTPADLEERYSLSGGHIYHGEHALDQLYALRPCADCSRYATPIEGLFLASSGCHPGGGVTCAPGVLAADAVLRKV